MPNCASGKSSYTFAKLWKLSTDGIIAYSDKPLRLAVRLGFLMAFSAFCYGAYVLRTSVSLARSGLDQSHLLLDLLGGIIIGILGNPGIYLGKTFDESKKRPLYIVRRTTFEEPPLAHCVCSRVRQGRRRTAHGSIRMAIGQAALAALGFRRLGERQDQRQGFHPQSGAHRGDR